MIISTQNNRNRQKYMFLDNVKAFDKVCLENSSKVNRNVEKKN